MMTVLSILVALGLSASVAVDYCEDLLNQVQDDPPEDTEAFVSLVDEGIACYGEPDEESAHPLGLLYYNLVFRLEDEGRYTEALETIDAFFNHFDDYDHDSWFYRMHQWRGYIHFFTGDLLRSVSSYADSLPYAEAFEPQHAGLIAGEAALLYYRLGDFERAHQFVDRGLALIAEADDVATETIDDVQLRLMGTQAAIFLEEGDATYSPDTTAIHQSQEIVRTILETIDYATDHDESVSSFIRLGQAGRLLGDFDESARYLRMALEASEEHAQRRQHAVIKTEKARLMLDMNVPDEALSLLERATEAVEPNDYRTIREIARSTGLAHLLQGNYESAVPHFETGIEASENERRDFRATEWSTLRTEWNNSYRLLASTYLLMGEEEKAFDIIGQSRARYLRDVRLQTRILDELPLEERVRFDELTSELTEVRHRLDTERGEGKEAIELLNREAQLVAKREDILALDEEIQTPSIDEIQEALAARDQTLLSYFVQSPADYTRASQEPMSYVFLVSGDTLIVEEVAATDRDITGLMEEISPLLTEGSTALTLNAAAFSLSSLHELYELLFAPVEDFLETNDRLVVVPDRDLFALPFGLLLSEPAPRFQYADAPYLLRSHPISVEVAEQLLLPEERRSHRSELDILALGRTTFEEAAPPLLAVRSGSTRPDEVRSPLPAVRSELEALQSHFRRSLTAIDEEATERFLLDNIDRSQVVHLASHVDLSAVNPFRNAIQLSPDPQDESGVFDGHFTLSKLGQRAVPVDLVVLSGCDTARGRHLAGEGMASLQFGFRSLGVRSSLATLWLVEDQSSAHMMELFYRELGNGAPKDVALQRAQLAFLETSPGGLQSPFFWAAPVLYGNPSPLELSVRPDRFTIALWSGGVLVLLLLAGLLYHRRRTIQTKST